MNLKAALRRELHNDRPFRNVFSVTGIASVLRVLERFPNMRLSSEQSSR